MLDDFRLRVFLAVAEKQSFKEAAAALGISQPAVSQNVAELEKSLGARLFERERGCAVLTEKGAMLTGYARQILHWYKVTQDAFSEAGPPPGMSVSLPLEDGSRAEIWTSQGDIHIKIKN